MPFRNCLEPSFKTKLTHPTNSWSEISNLIQNIWPNIRSHRSPQKHARSRDHVIPTYVSILLKSPGSFRLTGDRSAVQGQSASGWHTAKSKRSRNSQAGPDAMQTDPVSTEVTPLISMFNRLHFHQVRRSHQSEICVKYTSLFQSCSL